MTRRLLLTYLSITTFALVMVIVPLGLTFSSRERDRLLFDVERDAQAIASLSEEPLENGTRPDLSSAFTDYSVPGGRVIVVDRRGRSVADSEGQPLGRDFSTRAEVASALAGQRVSGRRRSNTLRVTLVYVAIPVASKGQVHGAVRITIPSATVDQRVRDTWVRLGALALVVLGTVGAVGLVLARSVTRPVRQVEEAARRLAGGDLSARAGQVGGAPELETLARQFDTTAERLAQLVESQRRFVADASHQLRTPLTALRLRLETMHPDSADEPKVAAALAETDRLGRLVQSLLVIARSDAHPMVTDVDLAAVVDGRRETWSEVADRDNVGIIVTGPNHLVVRAVDGGAEQILDNLLSNAVAVAPAGTNVTVVLSGLADGGGRLVVTDQGPGMTADERAQATARFWRAPGAAGKGSGLGLAIVDHLAMAAGGRVVIEAGPGGSGLRVVVDFAPAGPNP